MIKKNKFLILAVIAILILYIMNKKKISLWYDLAQNFIFGEEGFSAKPYWDVKRWSWGYGTRVPDSIDNKEVVPNKTITKYQAALDSMKYVKNDYDVLKLEQLQLPNNKIVAILSFSYNLGVGNAKKLLTKIKNNTVDEKYWLSYNKVNGLYDEKIENRRKREWKMFNKI